MATQNLDTTANSLAAVGDSDIVNWMASSQDITNSVDLSALANGLTSFYIAERVTHNLGSAGTPAKFDVDVGSAPYFRNAGQGVVYYTPDGVSNVCSRFYQVGTGRTEIVGSTGTMTTVSVSRGGFVIADGVALTTLYQSGGTSDTQWTAAGATITTATVVGGSAKLARQLTTLNVGGKGAVFLDTDTRAIGTLNMWGGMVVPYETGTITALNYYDGFLDLRNISRPITITTLTVASHVKGAYELATHPMLSVTNPIVYLGDQMA